MLKAPFKKILIANRGEIAVRIIRACAEMGITAVAVYSEVDRASEHVLMADEAYPIGPAASTESYLRIDKLIAVAQKSGAEALHPGYGFLAENAALARARPRGGHGFLWAAAGGGGGAVAGGGGKGMRISRTPEQGAGAWRDARSEAENAFGDPSLYVEKYLDRPRHVEIQVLGDHHGNLIHLGERECSMQRRHQKLVEECPSPIVTAARRGGEGAGGGGGGRGGGRP